MTLETKRLVDVPVVVKHPVCNFVGQKNHGVNKFRQFTTRFKLIATLRVMGTLLVCFETVTMFGVAQLSECIERNRAGEKIHEDLAGGI